MKTLTKKTSTTPYLTVKLEYFDDDRVSVHFERAPRSGLRYAPPPILGQARTLLFDMLGFIDELDPSAEARPVATLDIDRPCTDEGCPVDGFHFEGDEGCRVTREGVPVHDVLGYRPDCPVGLEQGTHPSGCPGCTCLEPREPELDPQDSN